MVRHLLPANSLAPLTLPATRAACIWQGCRQSCRTSPALAKSGIALGVRGSRLSVAAQASDLAAHNWAVGRFLHLMALSRPGRWLAYESQEFKEGVAFSG